MEYEKIKQLMDDMGNSKLSSIDIDFPDGTKISMKKNENVEISTKAMKSSSQEVKKEEPELEQSSDENTGKIVKSPMVGTFYIKPNPSANPYVEVGKKVKKGDVLCIIEAMKLMNEIESEFDGEIAEIFIKDGEAVEYGKPLFKII
jgi:acetyl-CoA carboxylase biotin carboxyl carrier protein